MFIFSQFPSIIKTFRLLARHKPAKLLVIFLLTLLMGINVGFSIVLLIPLLQLLQVGSSEPATAQATQFQNMANKVGVTLNIETVLIIYVLLLTITALLQYCKSVSDASYQQTFIYEIRSRLFRKIILADWSLLNNKSKTNHLQVLTKEVPNLATYIFFYLRGLASLIMTAAYIFYAIFLSAKFTIIIIVTGLVLFILLRKFLFKAFHLGEGVVKSYNHLLKYIDDFWLTVKIAKVHGSEIFYYTKFEKANTSLLDMEFRMERNHLLPQLIYSIAGVAVLVFVVYLGYRIDHIPLTSFFILILLFSRIFPQFVAINNSANMILSNAASFKLIQQLDEEFTDTIFHKPSIHHSIALEKEIRIKNLQFAYPNAGQLFNDFSDTFPAKKLTAIIGESGCGKTTLIDLIAGIQKPANGEILIDENPIADDMLPHWKSSIGYLPQESFFIDGSFRENLVWDSTGEISDEDIFNVLKQVNATQLVKRYKKELDEYIVNYQFNFSGGECQRLALARVLLRKPQLLLLDEATSSLDKENEKQIMELISVLKDQMTIIFVTHRHSILSYCDKVITL